MTDPQAAYEALVKAVEDKGFTVLMSVDGSIRLEASPLRPIEERDVDASTK